MATLDDKLRMSNAFSRQNFEAFSVVHRLMWEKVNETLSPSKLEESHHNSSIKKRKISCGDDSSPEYKKFKEPVQCSTLSAEEQKKYLQLFRIYSTRVLPSPTVAQKKEIKTLNQLYQKVLKEHEELNKYLESTIASRKQAFYYLHAEARRFLKEKLSYRYHVALTYPRHYVTEKTIAVPPPVEKLKKCHDLEYIGSVLQMGRVPRLVQLSLDRKCVLPLNYSRLKKHFTVHEKPTQKEHPSKKPMSQDTIAKNIVLKNNVDIVISMSALNAIVEGLGPGFNKEWCLPLKVTEVTQDNGSKGKVIFVDKPLLQHLNVKEMNTLFHKYAVKIHFTRFNPGKWRKTRLKEKDEHTDGVMACAESNQRTPQSVKDNLFDTECTPDISTLETFGVSESDINMKEPLKKTSLGMNSSLLAEDSFQQDEAQNSDCTVQETMKSNANADSSLTVNEVKESSTENASVARESDESHVTACSSTELKSSESNKEDEVNLVSGSPTLSISQLTKDINFDHSYGKVPFSCENQRKMNNSDDDSDCSSDRLVVDVAEHDDSQENKTEAISSEFCGENVLDFQSPKVSAEDYESKNCEDAPTVDLVDSSSVNSEGQNNTVKCIDTDVQAQSETAGSNTEDVHKQTEENEAQEPQEVLESGDSTKDNKHEKSIQREDSNLYPQLDENENVTYSLWNLGGIKLLLRQKIDCCNSVNNNPWILFPKMEYQSEFGAEINSPNELASQVVKMIFRPNSQVYRVRINALTSEVLMCEEVNTRNLTSLSSPSVTQEVLGHLCYVFEECLQLDCGQYMLLHHKGDNILTLLHESNKRASFDLHMEANMRLAALSDMESRNGEILSQNGASQEKISLLKTIPWLPIDPTIQLPSLVKLNRIPGTFPPKVRTPAYLRKRKMKQ